MKTLMTFFTGIMLIGCTGVDHQAMFGFSMGGVSALDGNGRTVWIVDAHRDGKCFLVRADEKLTAFVELERAIHAFAVSLIS